MQTMRHSQGKRQVCRVDTYLAKSVEDWGLPDCSHIRGSRSPSGKMLLRVVFKASFLLCREAGAKSCQTADTSPTQSIIPPQGGNQARGRQRPERRFFNIELPWGPGGDAFVFLGPCDEQAQWKSETHSEPIGIPRHHAKCGTEVRTDPQTPERGKNA